MAGLPEALRQSSRAGFLHVIQVKEELMDHTHPGNLEPIKIVTTDFALAYSAIARRVAAIDAILCSDQWPEHCIKRLRAESDAAMATIQQVETVRFTISTH